MQSLSLLRFRHRAVVSAVILMSLASLSGVARARPSEASPTFAATDFQSLWAKVDGPVANGQVSRSWLWGPAPGVSLNEPFAGAPAGALTVQYFDKARM